MSDKPYYEVARRVYMPGEPGVCIELLPHPDGGAYILMHTPEGVSKEWFGSIYAGMTKEYALALGKALIDAAGDV